MKATTLKKRLDKILTSKSAMSYRIAADVVNGTNKTYMIFGNIIRPCKTSGRGRFTTNLNYTSTTKYILTEIGVKFESGNDAPRGSETGNWIKILTKIK
jgi:hypothetical protein